MVEQVAIAFSCSCERSASTYCHGRISIPGESSSLRSIGKEAFRGSGVCGIHIPNSVEELCGLCFSGCKSLSGVTFGESSSLRRIGELAFLGSGVCEIHAPDSIERLLRDCTGLLPRCRIMKLT